MTSTFDAESELQRHGRALHALARALLRDEHAAADAVQDTMVTAIEHPPRDASAPGGWLQTVLRNVVWKRRRSETRRLRHQLAAQIQDEAPSAAEVASRRELSHAVVDAVLALEPPYRDAIWQRYFEDLAPAVIAARSGTPLATTKSRLQRGLAQLRERLGDRGPSWRAGLAAAFRLDEELAVTASGVLLMGIAMKLVWCGAATVAAVGALLWATSAAPVGKALASSPIGEAAVVTAELAPSSAPELRTEVAAGAPVVATAGLMVVRGRCVVAETGEPLAGCRVRLFGSWSNSHGLELYGDPHWQDPPAVESDPDGKFAIAFAPPKLFQFSLDIQHADRVPRTARWSHYEYGPGDDLDLGTIAFQRGYQVRGRVVDELGQPVAKIAVCVRSLPLPIRADMSANDTRVGWGRDDGSFIVEVPIPPGTWSVYTESAAFRQVSPPAVTVRSDGTSEPLIVVMKRMPSIAGVLIDDLGTPVAKAYIEMEDHSHNSRPACWADAEGHFELFRHAEDFVPTRLIVSMTGRCEPRVIEEQFEWGRHDLRIVLQRGLVVDLTVVEQGSGAPVEDYALTCRFLDGPQDWQGRTRLGGHHEGGRVAVDGIGRGRNELALVPRDPGLVSGAPLRFEARDGGVIPLRVELERLRPVSVRVVDAKGDPVPGSTVELIVRSADREVSDPDLHMSIDGYPGSPERNWHHLVCKAKTDEKGEAALFAPTARDRLLLRIRGRTHPTTLVPEPQLIAGKTLDVVVVTGGSITGKLVLPGLPMEQLTIELVRPDGVIAWLGDQEAIKVNGDGSFAAAGVRPGNYEAWLVYHTNLRDLNGSGGGGATRLQPALGPVTVVADQETRCGFDAAPHRVAEVRVRARCDAMNADGAGLLFQRIENGRETACYFGVYVLDGAGRMPPTNLLPGHYRVYLEVPDTANRRSTRLECGEQLDVMSGARIERELQFARVQLRIRLLEADGSPAKRTSMIVMREFEETTSTSDDDGLILLDPAPPEPIWLRVNGTEQKFGPFGVPVGKTAHEVTLTLPTRTAK
jgi:RNA polymerase sigma-70 factor (ECF subfamily)